MVGQLPGCGYNGNPSPSLANISKELLKLTKAFAASTTDTEFKATGGVTVLSLPSDTQAALGALFPALQYYYIERPEVAI